MFGFFKKKDPSKTFSKSKPSPNQTDIKESESNSKNQKNNKEKKVSQKLIVYGRQQTQGQFVQKKKVKKAVQPKRQQQQLVSKNFPTPKIQSKNPLKQLQQKVTYRPNKLVTEPSHNLSQPHCQAIVHEQFYYEDVKQKEVINLKTIKSILQQLNQLTDYESQTLISRQVYKNKSLRDHHFKLFYSKYFRFHQVKTVSQLIERYGEILQSIQILISKLNNRIGKGVHFHKNQIKDQEKLQVIYVRDESQFLLFFKHFFSKPYTLCNRASTRKIIQILWQSIAFKQTNPKKLYEQIKLWIYGISIPSNPTLIMLHKVILKNPEIIPKYAKMIYNDKIYMGMNETDPLSKVPLLLAAQIQSKKAMQKLIKCGANPHLSPIIMQKGQYSAQYSQTKYKKHLFTLNFPQYSRKSLSPLETLLLVKQDYGLLSDCFYCMQLANIRKLRKSSEFIRQKLRQMPDCTFQIGWKTCGGIFTFKELPSDLITVYKKGSMLRIDYNVDSIQSPVKGKHFSILIKCLEQLQFYEIRHHSKTILNKLSEIDMNVIKQRFNEFCSYPQSRNGQVSQCKGMYEVNEEGQKVNISMNVTIQNETVAPEGKRNTEWKKPPFKHVADYQKSIIESELIDYKAMAKSEIKAVVEQNIVNLDYLPIRTRSKTQKSGVNLQIQFEKQQLKLSHLCFVMQLFKTDSLLISKILKMIEVFNSQEVFSKLDIFSLLPTSTKLTLQGLSFQFQIKNITYIQLSDNVFNLEIKALQQMNYEEHMNSSALDSIQETVLMEEGYSINVSQFLGKTERLMQMEEEFARDKFEKLLEQEFMGGKAKCGQNILDDLDDD